MNILLYKTHIVIVPKSSGLFISRPYRPQQYRAATSATTRYATNNPNKRPLCRLLSFTTSLAFFINSAPKVTCSKDDQMTSKKDATLGAQKHYCKLNLPQLMDDRRTRFFEPTIIMDAEQAATASAMPAKSEALFQTLKKALPVQKKEIITIYTQKYHK